ncbi:divalent-cation tolerance protein CutA [Balneolales bacterium ANBcel1]|nr:divalent-cation tolerance protein CutA [Balneolales bacterium ANBcel1]
MEHVFVYITAADQKEAEMLSRHIVQERLAACTNILGNISALFFWDDAVQKEQEVALIAKTTVSAFPRLQERVKELHSYECPCVIALPIAMGNPDYLSWIDNEVAN